MASEASRDAINASLVANTAGLYDQLAGLREIEAITRRAVDSQREVLRLVRRLSQAGVSSAAEERQQENSSPTPSRHRLSCSARLRPPRMHCRS